jgi:hypothetical protein
MPEAKSLSQLRRMPEPATMSISVAHHILHHGACKVTSGSCELLHILYAVYNYGKGVGGDPKILEEVFCSACEEEQYIVEETGEPPTTLSCAHTCR